MKDSEGLRSVLLRMERLGGRSGHPTSPSAHAIPSKRHEALNHVHKFELKVSSRRLVWDPYLLTSFSLPSRAKRN